MDEYRFSSSLSPESHESLLPALMDILRNDLGVPSGASLFEVGCGNGALAAELSKVGYEVTGIDASTSGVEQARTAHPTLNLTVASAYDDLAGIFGTFDVVISLEVVEHCFYPKRFADTVYRLTKPGGVAIVSTPYHGYWKNLAIALLGRWDKHLDPLWDHGHIKMFSIHTLSKLLLDVGFAEVGFRYVGRVFPFSKSMIAVARKPPIRKVSR